MNVKSVEKLENSKVELLIEVSGEELEAAIDAVYKKQRGSINVPGFRKGHAPRKVIEGMYGATVFHNDAVNESYHEYYEQAIRQEGLESVGYTDITVLEVGKTGYTFKAVLTVRPEVTLGQYKGIVVPAADLTVTEEDIETEMKAYVNRATRLVAVERPSKKWDTVVIDFQGFLDGEAFEGGDAEGYELELGSGSFIPGFEEKIIGMKAGEEADLDLTFPEEYHEELAGKPVVFHVKVNEVKEKALPEMDDEFAKDVSEFETLAELRQSLADGAREHKQSQAKQAFEDAAVAKAVEGMQAEVPADMVQYQSDRLFNSFKDRITAQGIPFEQYIEMMGMTPETLKNQANESAQEMVRRELLLHAVAQAEGMALTDEELDEAYAEIATEYQMPIEQVKKNIPVSDVAKDQLDRKARQFIIDNAVEGEVEATAETAPSEEPVAEQSAPADEKPKRKRAAAKKEPADATDEKSAEVTAPKKRSSAKKAEKAEKTEE